MAKILSIYNQKGGQGKTTITLSVCHELVRRGYRVLAIDLDTQYNLTSNLINIPDEVRLGIYEVFLNPSMIHDAIIPAKYGIDIIGGSKKTVNISFGENSYPDQLKRALDMVADDYDYIFIDCSPSFSPLSVRMYFALDYLLIIACPEGQDTVEGIINVYRNAMELNANVGSNIRIIGLMLNQFVSDRSLHSRWHKEEIHGKLAQEIGCRAYPPIYKSSSFISAASQRESIMALNSTLKKDRERDQKAQNNIREVVDCILEDTK